MTWGQEIFRALLLTLGFTEILTNITYLTKENGLVLARKQHGELPKNISDKKIKVKVICMLVFGIALFGVALSTYVLHSYSRNIILLTTISFSVYGIIEALYYRYWKTCGFALVTILLVVCAIFI